MTPLSLGLLSCKTRNPLSFFKLCLYIPKKKKFGIKFFHDWIYSKFHLTNASSYALENDLKNSLFKQDQCTVLVQNGLEIENELKTQFYNHKSHFSGANGAFYMLDIHLNSQNEFMYLF